jgi:hypothetical protein
MHSRVTTNRFPLTPDLMTTARGFSSRRRACVTAILLLFLTVATNVFAGSPACAPAPRSTCRHSQVPAQTRIWLNNRSADLRDTIVWKWRRGAGTAKSDFGDPIHLQGYAMCIYGSGGSLLFDGTVPSGGSCGARSCWRGSGPGFKYRNGTAVPDGLTKILLVPGDAGHASVVVKGRGVNLDVPPLPLALPITVQLQQESGPCWEAVYDAAGVRRNEAERFRASAAH